VHGHAIPAATSGGKLPTYDPNLLGGRSVVPYIVSWTGEQRLQPSVIHRPGRGIGYTDETLLDRDKRGVLWNRMASHPGSGRPVFNEVHALRQRRAMRRLLCQVCAQPASQTEEGVLWLLPDHREDWPDWPEGMANTFPPLCVACARLSVRLCPFLRPGHVAIRTGASPITAVSGGRYQMSGFRPRLVERVTVGYDDPAIRWVCAAQLVRTLHDCTIVNLD
jgi:hypothetical protein